VQSGISIYITVIKTLILLVLCIFFLTYSTGQEIIRAVPVSTAPVIDGILSGNEWGAADSVTGFIQLEPDKGNISKEKTTVYVCYDSLNLYFGFICYQQTGIVGNVQTRDQVKESDDAVIIVLDTYFDNRSGYAFVINPIGTQTDFKISDDGRNTNYDWDTEWISAATKFSGGWSAEAAIPFKNIKYRLSLQKWGINFGRIIRHTSETSWWTPNMSDNFRISQGGILEGIKAPQKTERFLITPYASLRYEDSDISGVYEKFIFDGGGDIKYNIKSNLTFDATINPDFASIEGDREKIDLSGWEISFPEKRLFFQEGNELFSMRYNLFYSRRIGDIDYGANFTGKAGGYAMNILHAHTLEDTTLGLPAAFFTAGRVKKDIFKSSTVGLTFVDKTTDTSGVRSFGADWVLNPGVSWKITGQLIGSSPGDLFEHSAGFLRVAHESNKHHVHIRYSDLGRSFRENVNETGFIRDDDRHELDADLIYKFWFKESLFQYISFAAMNNAYWGQNGQFKSSKFRDNARFYLNNRFSLDLYYENENRLVDASDMTTVTDTRFYNYFLRSTAGYNTDESSYASIYYTFGKNFRRKIYIWEGNISVKPLKKIAFKYSITSLSFSPENQDSLLLRLQHSTLLNIFSTDYYFTNNLWVRIFAQHDTYKKRFYLYGKFGWRFKPPFGALYLIYAGDDYIDTYSDVQIRSKTVFLKLTYPIGF